MNFIQGAVDQLVLKTLQFDTTSKMAYQMMSVMPELNGIFVPLCMVWKLLTYENKQLLEDFIKKTLPDYHTKYLILTTVAKHAPELNIEVQLPREMEPILKALEINPTIPMSQLQQEVNTHITVLFKWISEHKNIVTEMTNQIYEKIKNMKTMGGTKRKKSKRKKSRKKL
jgi:hypothetical protein